MASGEESKAADEKPWTDRMVEVAAAVLLAAATVASAWCAYQSERWSGVQTFWLNDSDVADRQAVKLSLKANQTRLLDEVIFVRFMTAVEQGNQRLQQFYMESFRPEMRKAVDAWLAKRPTSGPAVHPMALPEYRLALDEQVEREMQKAAEYHKEATEAKHASDLYVLLTVLLASVLFFGGIATHFVSSQVKIAVFALGILTFIGVLFWLSKCPMAP